MLRAVFVLILSSTALQAASPTLTADEDIVFDQTDGSLVARGNAVFAHDELTVKADEIRFFRAEQRAEASGNVELTVPDARLLAQDVRYWVEDRRFEVGPFRAGAPPLLIEGDSASGSAQVFDISGATIYYREPAPWSIRVRVQGATLRPGESLSAQEIRLLTGDLPLLILPEAERTVRSLNPEISGRLGYRGNLGAYVRSRVLFPYGEDFRFGGELDLYSSRGVLFGPAYEWLVDDENMTARSELFGGYINDFGDKGIDALGDAVPEDRWVFALRHQQRWANGFSLDAALNTWSDSEAARDFRPELYREAEQPDAWVEGAYAGDGFLLSAFLRFDPNDFFVTQQRLPEVSFDVMPRPVADTGILGSLHASAVRLKEDPNLRGTNDREADRLDALYMLYDPIVLTEGVTFTPRAGVRATWFGDTATTRGSFTRLMGELGADLELTASRTWAFRSESWNIDGLRHVIRPVVRYRYHPEGSAGQADIIPIDDRATLPAMPSIDLADMRHLDVLSDLHVVRFGLENVLQTRRAVRPREGTSEPAFGARDLLRFDVFQDIDLDAAPSAPTFPFTYVRFSSDPAPWLSIDWEHQFDTEELQRNYDRFGITLRDGDIWTASFYVDSFEEQFRQYAVEGFYRINARWGAGLRIRYDDIRSQFTEQRYSLFQTLGDTWRVEYAVSVREGSAREDDIGFSLRVRLLTF